MTALPVEDDWPEPWPQDKIAANPYGAPYWLPRPPPLPTGDWQDRAACKGSNPEMFFPNKARSASASDEARVVCAHCPVKVECKEYADNNRLRYGVWGGVPESVRMPKRASGARKKK